MSQPPEPPRPLASHGRSLWDRAWSTDGDVERLLIVCEQVDERQSLRLRVLRDNDPRERASLRALDRAISAGLSALGVAADTPVASAAGAGRLEGLEAIRDKLAADLDHASPQVAAQLAAQLRATLAEIAEISRDAEGSWSDELAERRVARGAGADKPATAKRIAKRTS